MQTAMIHVSFVPTIAKTIPINSKIHATKNKKFSYRFALDTRTRTQRSIALNCQRLIKRTVTVIVIGETKIKPLQRKNKTKINKVCRRFLRIFFVLFCYATKICLKIRHNCKKNKQQLTIKFCHKLN